MINFLNGFCCVFNEFNTPRWSFKISIFLNLIYRIFYFLLMNFQVIKKFFRRFDDHIFWYFYRPTTFLLFFAFRTIVPFSIDIIETDMFPSMLRALYFARFIFFYLLPQMLILPRVLRILIVRSLMCTFMGTWEITAMKFVETFFPALFAACIVATR